jgi:RimJ/RimL family protein N-acetyltransferase
MYYGEKVKLRALELSDLDDIMRYWNTYDTRRFLYSAVPTSENAERAWLESVSKSDVWKDCYLHLAFEDKKTKEFLGVVGFNRISVQHRRAEFGIAIHNPENYGKGYGTDATRVMLWVGFHVLGLNSIFLTAMESNTRGLRAYEKAGFKRNGIFRNALYSGGRFQTTVVMDVLQEEFAEMYPGNRQIGTPD